MLNRFGFSEFDALTGCKIASIDIGSPAVKMLYSPTSSNAVVAILEVSFYSRLLLDSCLITVWCFRIVQLGLVTLRRSRLVSCTLLRRGVSTFPLIQKSISQWRHYNLLCFSDSRKEWVWQVCVLTSLTFSWISRSRWIFADGLLCFVAVVVGTVEGGRAPTKIKTDLKKPIVNIACHPRLPVLVWYDTSSMFNVVWNLVLLH